MKTLKFPALGLLVLVAVLAMPDAHAKKSIPGYEIESLPGAKAYVFETINDKPLRLHVFNPPGLKPGERRPAIVIFFGGSWRHGNPTQFVKYAEYFASRGMVAILPDYRTRMFFDTTPFEAVADAKTAIRWVRSHAAELSVDPDRIAAGGGSAGGHVATCAAMLDAIDNPGTDKSVSSRPGALILLNPVLDATTPRLAKWFGTRAEEGSPVHHIKGGLPPTIIFHGRADTTAPFENSERFAVGSKKAGNACTLVAYDGVKHGFYWKDPYFTDTCRRSDDFLVSLGWLTGESPLPKKEITPPSAKAADAPEGSE
jgi:acetyl esterase